MKKFFSEDITIIIKTFNRKESLIKLLKSIEKLEMTYPIAIADDSEVPYRDEILQLFPDLQISYYNIPFDSGLSYGRNFLLQKINTELFVLCDDDFYFDKRTDIEKARNLLISKDVDILSGVLYNFFKVSNLFDKCLLLTQHLYSKGFSQTYVGTIEKSNDKVRIDIKTRVKCDFIRCDTVHNFFIGKKSSILAMGGWDKDLKLSEHGDFFLRAKEAGIKVGHSSLWGVRHYPVIKKDYISYRRRDYEIMLFDKHNINEWIDDIDNGSTFIRKRVNDSIVIERKYHKNLRGTIRKVYNKLK